MGSRGKRMLCMALAKNTEKTEQMADTSFTSRNYETTSTMNDISELDIGKLKSIYGSSDDLDFGLDLQYEMARYDDESDIDPGSEANKQICGSDGKRRLSARRNLFNSESTKELSEVTVGSSTQKSDNPSQNNTKIARSCKKYFCFYCHTLVCKIARHLELLHKDEIDVQKFTSLPKGSAGRKNIIATLRKNGDFIYNTNQQNHDIIPCRREQRNKKRDPDYYKVCPNCKDFFSKLSLRKHVKKCSQTDITGKRDISVSSKKVYYPLHNKASDVLKREIFPVFREDEISSLLRFDELAILYGNKLCIKYRSEHHHNMIRARMRLIGRFLLAMKKVNSHVTDLASVFQPNAYDDTVKAINIVAQLDQVTGKYKSPSTAFALGTALKVNANLLILECIKSGNKYKKKLANDFLKLLGEDLGTSINKTVSENQLEMKRQKTQKLPSDDDIKMLNLYLAKKRKKSYENLRKQFSFEAWKELASSTLTSIQVFNRRRPGEIERAQISDFNAYETVNEDTDSAIFQSLSFESQEAAKRYVRFQIRGKLARGVPVLLHTELVDYVKLIIKLRTKANVPEKNPYIFGLPGNTTNNHLNANKLLRYYSTLCGARYPNLLRATHLRKHVATRSVLLNLQDHEVNDLATFLGHADKIHRDHYRLPIATREIALMSKLLESVQGQHTDSDQELLEEDNSHENGQASEIPASPSTPQRDSTDELGSQHELLDTSVSNTSNDTNTMVNNTIIDSISCTSSQFTVDSEGLPVRYIRRRTWATPEKYTARILLNKYVSTEKLPSYEECENFIFSHPCLQSRTPMQLKLWIQNQKKLKLNTGKHTRGRSTWTTPERHAARRIFRRNILQKKLPSLLECQEAIDQNDALRRRKPTLVKAYINNEINRTKHSSNDF